MTGGWTREKLAWMAGLYEGEGCCTITERGPLRLQFAMTDRDVLERFAALAGYGQPSLRPHRNYGLGKLPVWDYRIAGVKAYALLVAMWPWLCSRRRNRIREATARWRMRKSRPWKITAAQVIEIRAARYGVLKGRHGAISLRTLARRYGVSVGLIGQIAAGRVRRGPKCVGSLTTRGIA